MRPARRCERLWARTLGRAVALLPGESGELLHAINRAFKCLQQGSGLQHKHGASCVQLKQHSGIPACCSTHAAPRIRAFRRSQRLAGHLTSSPIFHFGRHYACSQYPRRRAGKQSVRAVLPNMQTQCSKAVRRTEALQHEADSNRKRP
jgi:hypothetical protein